MNLKQKDKALVPTLPIDLMWYDLICPVVAYCDLIEWISNCNVGTHIWDLLLDTKLIVWSI